MNGVILVQNLISAIIVGKLSENWELAKSTYLFIQGKDHINVNCVISHLLQKQLFVIIRKFMKDCQEVLVLERVVCAAIYIKK
jgi:hypothetical protein